MYMERRLMFTNQYFCPLFDDVVLACTEQPLSWTLFSREGTCTSYGKRLPVGGPFIVRPPSRW